MSFFKKILILGWRIWFYLLVLVSLLIMFPLLLIFTASEKLYPYFFKLARVWAKTILYGMGFFPIIKYQQQLIPNKSYMLIANHTSMTDIMLMLCVVKTPFVFVGKKELAKLPIFGFFYKRTCILVDRNNAHSRKAVFESANQRLLQGNSICIFPEGGVPDDISVALDSFKDGAFRLAIEHQIPIVPMVFYDNKKRFPYVFFKGSPGRMRAKVLPFIETKGKNINDKKELREKAHHMILEELKSKF
ncbi:1-acyl-sn-glycerol-3-phosphate acyltransferase [Mesonia hippocampi]|uniref:1-acyl-sn-glycerol-3-phosphate acyltransferase n=1 Tax=Mesonia hippocampi TaxID=1628250 RepID=A0A840EP33_9FLAO|nr:lysophospholipid acyltransferase family protein [Mesonia hippocampi]MBB4118353.1 1-acyl-sn-glycerol-3-phosphate acyltransferase [Mesonia hippocampi]